MSDRFKSRQVPSCPGGTVYTIIPGDSYFGLARRFNITVESITAANPGVDSQNLQLGQRICIPVPPSDTACPGGFLYIIQAGDTFFSIARQFGTVVPAIVAANPDVDQNSLRIGQSICVPAPIPIACPTGRIYKIIAGDTLFSIARRFNSSVDAITRANPGLDPRSLQVARLICIPR